MSLLLWAPLYFIWTHIWTNLRIHTGYFWHGKTNICRHIKKKTVCWLMAVTTKNYLRQCASTKWNLIFYRKNKPHRRRPLRRRRNSQMTFPTTTTKPCSQWRLIHYHKTWLALNVSMRSATMREFPIVIMKLIYDDEDSHGVSKGGLRLKDVHFRIIFMKNTPKFFKLY